LRFSEGLFHSLSVVLQPFVDDARFQQLLGLLLQRCEGLHPGPLSGYDLGPQHSDLTTIGERVNRLQAVGLGLKHRALCGTVVLDNFARLVTLPLNVILWFINH
jgi:hypothetical protein